MNKTQRSENKLRILIVGIGNTLRSDDGLGAFVCTELDKRKPPGIDIRILPDLQIELASELFNYDYLLVVDAAISGNEPVIIRVEDPVTSPAVTSHHLNAAVLSGLCNSLYQHSINAFVCSVPGANFETGDRLSPFARKNAGQAVEMILKTVKEWNS